MSKCDELKRKYSDITGPYFGYNEVKAIAELKAKLDEKDKDIAYWRKEYDEETKLTDTLKAEIETLKASHYAEMVDAGMRERRLKRALYKACAMWADRTRLICSVFGSNAPKIRWERMLDKCRAKAEQYK